MGTVDTSTRLAILTACRDPRWVAQSSYDGIPTTDDFGVSLVSGDSKGVIGAHAAVRLRAHVAYRTVTLTIDTLDLTATYTTTIEGTGAAYDAAADFAATEADVLDGIAAAINGNGTISPKVLATVSGSSVVITGKAAILGVDYSVTWSVTGSGELAATGDACSCTMEAWRQYRTATGYTAPGGSSAGASGDWIRVPGSGDYGTLDYGGWGDLIAVPGSARLYVQLIDVAGHASDHADLEPTAEVKIGPCALE